MDRREEDGNDDAQVGTVRVSISVRDHRRGTTHESLASFANSVFDYFSIDILVCLALGMTSLAVMVALSAEHLQGRIARQDRVLFI